MHWLSFELTGAALAAPSCESLGRSAKARRQGTGVSRVDEVLSEVGRAYAGARWIKGFSLGMRQRLGLLRSYADQGRTVLVSSHLLAEVAQTVDDVVIIAAGRLITQFSLVDLANRATPGVRVRTPQAAALREALAARDLLADVRGGDTVVALATTTETVG